MNYSSLDDFSRDTQTMAYLPEHVRAFGGRSTIGRVDGTVTGAERFFCPPVTAEAVSLTVDIHVVSHGTVITDNARTGHGIPLQLKLQQERWHPSYIYRSGAVHQYLGSGRELSLLVESWVIPSAVDDAFYLKLQLENLTEESVELELKPNWRSMRFGTSGSQEWGWDPPVPPEEEAKRIQDGVYQGDGAYMTLIWSGQCCPGETGTMSLSGLQTKEIILKVAFSQDQAPCVSHLEQEAEESLKFREGRWKWFWEACPHLQTSHQGLQKAYYHSLLGQFLCKWESPHFIINPFYSEAGLNGGALCTYTWGEAYVSKLTALIERENYENSILAHMRMGMESHYAFDPITGNGVGPCYSYNLFCIVLAIQDYIACTGNRGFLTASVDGMPFYLKLAELVEEMEGRLDSNGVLLDYGEHHNLLEMRGSGYEHFVPSPNGERVVIYRYLAQVLEEFGHHEESQRYLEKAQAVKTEISDKLWDDKAQWLKCIYPDGHEELVYSIQIFDLLGKDLLNEQQEKAVIARINEDEFLSEYGVHSVSKQDRLHFDLGDVDWSGAGAYLGDPCNLIETLYGMGEPQKAWDAAKRILWWSDRYPYWPQCIWAGKQEYSHWEQPLCRSCLAFAQAVVFGMFGLRIQGEKVMLNPQLPPEASDAVLTNIRVGNQVLQSDKVR